jgi:WD40 repeat protein
MPDVFISYSRRDKDFVSRLNQALADSGKDAWVDWEDIPASAEWLREIQDGIDGSDAFLFVLSPDSVASTVCAQELDHALERRKRILPIVHRDVNPADVRPEAAAINWVYLRDQDSFEEGLHTLVRALETDLEHVRAHTHLAGQAIDWERTGHDRARLLRGSELQEAERWLTEAAAKEPGATELQAQFVQASRDAARRRGRILFAGVAFALVVAIALAVVALIQRSNAIHQSHVAFARQLDADAQNQYTSDPELGVLLAVHAAQVAPSSQTRESLRQALGQSHVRERYTNPNGSIGDALWSPDGTRLLISLYGANKSEIVRPGSRAKPIVLSTPGVSSQLSWASHGKVVLTGSAAPTLWNASTGARIHRLPIRAVLSSVSPNGRVAATADLHGMLHLWDVATGRQLAQARPAAAGDPGCLTWSPDGSEVAECTVRLSPTQVAKGAPTPETATVFSATGHRLSSVVEPQVIYQVAFSPDGAKLAVATANHLTSPGTLVYDAHTGRQLLSIKGPATAVDFSPDGSELAYAQEQGNIAYVYSFNTGKTVPLVGNTGTINSIQFNHTGVYVLTSSEDGTARVFNATFGTPLEVMAGDNQGITDASWSPDDTRVATASKDGTARVWTTPAPRAIARRPLVSGLINISVSPDGAMTLVAGPASPSALVLNSRTLATRATLTPPAGQAFGGTGFSPDGRWIALFSGRASSRGGIVPQHLLIYSARTAKLTATLAPPGGAPGAAAFDRQGHVATLLADGQVDIWSAATGRHLRTLLPAGKPAETVTYSHDGAQLAVTRPDGSIDVLNASGGLVHTLKGPHPVSQYQGLSGGVLPVRAEFSPDGRWLVSTDQASSNGKYHVSVWNLATGRRARELTAGGTPLDSLAFDVTGTKLAAGDSAYAYLWNFPSGIPGRTVNQASASTFGGLSELSGLGGVQVAFSRDANTLTTVGDQATREWEVQTGQLLFDLPFTLSGQAASNGQRIVADGPGGLAEYNCELCGGLSQLLSVARHNLTRNLTPGERALYLRQG